MVHQRLFQGGRGVITPLWYVKKCRNLGQTLEFLKDFCYKPNQPDPNNSQIVAFLESKLLKNTFLDTPKGCIGNYIVSV